jgi:serine protease
MNLRLAPLLTLLAALALSALGSAPAQAAAERGPLRPAASAPGEDPNGARVIVKFKAQGSLMQALSASAPRAQGPQAASWLAQRFGLALRDGRVVDARSQVVFGDKSLSSAALAARLGSDPDVEYAVPDYRRHALAVPNDPLYAASPTISPPAGQWYLRAPNSTLVSAIDAEAAWSLTTGSASVVVADLDTGVRFDHPDLANKLFPGYDFISNLCVAGDGDLRDADASDPGDWIATAGQCFSDTVVQDSSWHGTQTASLLGAQTNNGVGMASTGYDTMVLPVRVLGKGGGNDSDIIAGMLWAGGISSDPVVNLHPARVLNLSLGSANSPCTQAYIDAISALNAAGVVVVAAAGNEEGKVVDAPANCPGVIAVAGVRHTGTKVGYSNVGPEVAISAPAGNCVTLTGPCVYPIITATNTGTTTPATNTYTNGTNYAVGTSFSTPMVAATAALMLAANPTLTPAQVKTLLQSSARAFPTLSADPTVTQCHAPNGTVQDECLCTTTTCGAGLLDTAAAVALAAQAAVPPVAIIVPSTTSATAGNTVKLDGGPSSRAVVSYQWSLVSGGSIASFSTSTTTAATTLLTTVPGSVTVRLTVTDATGATASTDTTIVVLARPTAVIAVSPSAPLVGATVTLDGSGSVASTGRTITGYQWAITSGGTIASFSGSTTAAITTATTSAAGSFTVQLTVTDSAGAQSSSASVVSVSSPSTSTTTTSSGGGGGAMSLAWLAALMLAVVALRWPAPRVSATRRARTGR